MDKAKAGNCAKSGFLVFFSGIRSRFIIVFPMCSGIFSIAHFWSDLPATLSQLLYSISPKQL